MYAVSVYVERDGGIDRYIDGRSVFIKREREMER